MSASDRAAAGEPDAGAVEALLGQPPWSDRAEVLTLLVTEPPEGAPPGPARLWLILDAAEVRYLDDGWRDPLLRHRLHRVRSESHELTVVTAEGAAVMLEGVSRRSLEVRWEIGHAIALHDPRGRFDGLAAASRRLPEGALERTVRPLYLQAYRAIEALGDTGAGAPAALIASGEAASALTRLACILEEGAHPTIDWLPAAARGTALGRRIAPWLGTFAPATGPQVLDEVARALRSTFADREWLREPESYALRPPPRR